MPVKSDLESLKSFRTRRTCYTAGKRITSTKRWKFFVWYITYMLLTTLPDRYYERIISLVPSQTELLYDLGLEKEVIGITKFCVHPKTWFTSKNRIGGTKDLHLDAVFSLRPDLIIANKEENVREQIEKLSLHFDVWVTDVNNLEDALQMILDIGTLTGKIQASLKIKNEIQFRFDQLRQLTDKRSKLRVAYLIWQQPFMVAANNTFINDMVIRAGLINVFDNQFRYPLTTLQELKKLKPECIFLSSEPYPFSLKHQQEFQKLMPGTKIILVDGEMFSWYGSRLLKTPHYLSNNIKI